MKNFHLLFCLLFSLPVFGQIPQIQPKAKWVKDTDSIFFENPQDIFLYLFKEKFDIALPPMETRSYNNEAYLRPDSVFRLSAQKKTVLSTGLYFAQLDTNQLKGTSFLVATTDFPKFTQLTHLIECLAYISTKEELNQLRSSRQKIDLDRFWLNIGGTPENARLLIKKYYDNIRYANENFTDYKQGWKTDRGMIYVVFGKPDQIQERENYQKWIYFNWNIEFEFLLQDTFFMPSYVLMRRGSYQKFWNFAVLRWRQGIN